MATAGYCEARRQIPPRAAPSQAGGWPVAIMPFLEQSERAEDLVHNPSLEPATMSPWARQRLLMMTCPSVFDDENEPPLVPLAHYALATSPTREVFYLGDAPTGFAVQWIAGPEVEFLVWIRDPGPHEGGSHVASSDGAVTLRVPQSN